MVKTTLYIARHGKTMFNTIGRAQGWSDTPLTAAGERGIKELAVGLKSFDLTFKEAFSSDSGRTLQTMEIILDELGQTDIPYTRDKRIREWCFGSLDGGYDAELFFGVLPRIYGTDIEFRKLTYEEMAAGIFEADTAGWAQPWEVIKERILSGFTDIAKKIEAQGGGKAIVVSHGMTISTLVYLLAPEIPKQNLDNGSVTVLSYENGQFTVEIVGDMSYRLRGAEVLDGGQ
ncbi:putative phosphoglycerate mutase [Streptococcus rupicaprae]|uniref:Histidine phosphatase family protein n=2 Tax=Streptococcus TaxID=1301 RepID=A0A7X6S190_9STRE|nr:histidine phosphatase family protein [Streptococcus ovuberis]NKZ20552.1 histidine phosphatase family protein [Streptococcus ovuberis]